MELKKVEQWNNNGKLQNVDLMKLRESMHKVSEDNVRDKAVHTVESPEKLTVSSKKMCM